MKITIYPLIAGGIFIGLVISANNSALSSQECVVENQISVNIRKENNLECTQNNINEKGIVRLVSELSAKNDLLISNYNKLLQEFENLSGAVVSFNLSKCPDGWDDYKPAYGRFIRGIDKTGNIDPDKGRSSGELQEDSFQKHAHSISGAKTAGHQPAVGSPHGYSHGALGNTINNTNGPSSGSVSGETRPKNVSLLYCIKN